MKQGTEIIADDGGVTEWKKIDFGEAYYVSNNGRVLSKEKIFRGGKGNAAKRCPEYEKVPGLDKDGYPRVVLKYNGKRKIVHIHRLVAEAFIPNPENKPCVNHINGIKTDNRVENLEWVTYSENTRHAIGLGLIEIGSGDAARYRKLNNQVISEIRSSTLNRADLANAYGVSITTIRDIQIFKTWRIIK